MDRTGGCCIARNTNHPAAPSDLSRLYDQIMLRFRPIAPKPPPASRTGVLGGFEVSISGGQKRSRKRKSSSSAERLSGAEQEAVKPIMTLSLLPEKPDLMDVAGKTDSRDAMTGDRTVRIVKPGHVVVECVMGTWADGVGNMERIILYQDTCPGFVSDEWGHVTWTNDAFKRICDVAADVVVVVMPEKAASSGEGFACMVRVKGMVSSWLTKVAVPADVWRVESGGGGGGFAWRLDVEAALRLGR